MWSICVYVRVFVWLVSVYVCVCGVWFVCRVGECINLFSFSFIW